MLWKKLKQDVRGDARLVMSRLVVSRREPKPSEDLSRVASREESMR